MPPSTSLLLHAVLGRRGRASRTSACPTYPWWPKTRTPSGSRQDRQLVRQRRAHGLDRFRDSRVVSDGLVRRTHPPVLVRDPRGEFKPQAILCTDLGADPQKIFSWYVMRWQLEVTFREARRHLGFETQGQRSGLAMRRTTPALLGLRKAHPTFAGALALVRKPGRAERADKQRRRRSVPTSFTNVREN
jgi:hypothetical protein